MIITFKMCQGHNLKYGDEFRREFELQGYRYYHQWVAQEECIYCKEEKSHVNPKEVN